MYVLWIYYESFCRSFSLYSYPGFFLAHLVLLFSVLWAQYFKALETRISLTCVKRVLSFSAKLTTPWKMGGRGKQGSLALSSTAWVRKDRVFLGLERLRVVQKSKGWNSVSGEDWPGHRGYGVCEQRGEVQSATQGTWPLKAEPENDGSAK